MSEHFSVETGNDPLWPGSVVTLRDHAAGSWVRLLPETGCNLVSFGATLAGVERECLLQPADETPARGPENDGAPVLFPFPNRLRNGRAQFEGRTIQIDRAPGQPHAIHGLVRHRRWQVDHIGSEPSGVVARCSVEADAETLRQFPFPYRLMLTFRLLGPTLRVEIETENTGDAPMPMGFGWHPYFRLPLVPGGNRRDAVVQIPARRQWELDQTLVPTGTTRPIPPERDFRQARPLGELKLDDVYTDIERADGRSRCRLTDPSTGVRLDVTAGPTFREWVVYAPPTRPTICFEPYTCPTDAFNLAARGLDAGVIVLPPGEGWSDWIELSLILKEE